MGLKIKTFEGILRGMTDWVIQNSSHLVDFSTGSGIRTLLESVAEEIEDFYFKIWRNFNYAQKNSIYDSFDFPRKKAVAAYNYETIYFVDPLPYDLLIPSGTEFATDATNMDINNGASLYYQTHVNYTVKAGQTSARVMVYCETPGTVGNISANTLTVLTQAIPYVSRVTNEERFSTGEDQESMSDRKKRFVKFISTRARGTVAALEYGALEVPEVNGVYVDESRSGLVYLYCHDKAGNLPDDVLRRVEENEINYKAAGIPLFILPIFKKEVDIEVELTVVYQNNTDEFKEYIVENIQKFFDQFKAGQSYSESDFNLFIRQLDVASITDATIVSPSDDFSVTPSELIRSGNVSVHLINEGDNEDV